MNRKFLSLLAITFACILFLGIGLLSSTHKVAKADDVPDEIQISSEGYKKDRKGPVSFQHMKHAVDYGVACTDCHHDYVDGKNVWKNGDPVKKCIDCHDPQKKQGNVMKLNLAFHKNCKDCHKASGKDEAPYQKCSDCHGD